MSLKSEDQKSIEDLKKFNNKLRGMFCYAYIAHSDIRRAFTDPESKDEDVGGWLMRNSKNEIVVCHGLSYIEVCPWKDVTFVGRIMEGLGMATVKQLKEFVAQYNINFEKV